MVPDPSLPGAQELLSANVRRLRIARSLSLSDLARATGLSKATLSGVEGGTGNPTVRTIEILADALEVRPADLVAAPPLEPVRVVRAARDDPDVSMAVRWRELEVISPFGKGKLSELALGPERLLEPELQAEGSRAHVYILQGKVIAGPAERITELAPGDYASFPADTPHLFETGRHGARILLLTQAPR